MDDPDDWDDRSDVGDRGGSPAADDGMEPFGNAVRHVRKARGLSQRALAARLGVGPSVVARLESGRLGLTLEAAISLYRVMGFELVLRHTFPCPSDGRRSADCADWDSDGAVAFVDLAGRAFPAHGRVQVMHDVPTWWGARYGWGVSRRGDFTWSREW